jgi:hypothetical protein
MGNFNYVTMGSGVLRVGGLDVGFLKGDVRFKYSYDVEEFKTGIPRTLRGSVTREVLAELTAPVAEINAENLAQVLGGLTPLETAASEVDKTGDFETLTFAPPPWSAPSGVECVKLGPTANRELRVAITPGSLVLKNSAESETYAVNNDFVLDGKTGYVYANPGGAIIPGQVVKAKYKFTPPASKQLQMGSQFSLSEVRVEFEHTNPHTGKRITVLFWKANASGKAQLTFAEDRWLVGDATFKAVLDESHPANPLGYISFET